MKPSYQYFALKKISRKVLYICLHQNSIAFLWRFYLNGQSFLLPGGKRLSTRASVKVFIKFAVQFFFNRYFRLDPAAVIELPVYGHLCLKIRRGYKVFDLERQVVVKMFADDIHVATVQEEILQAQCLGRYSFAPEFLSGSEQERWYEEEFIKGSPPDRTCWKSFLKTVHEDLLPLIEQIVLTLQPHQRRLSAYVDEVYPQSVRKKLFLDYEGFSSGKNQHIFNFLNSISTRIQEHENTLIYLTFTHGDFGPRHVLKTEDRRVLVDWEGAGIRSVTYDLFDAFFERLWKNDIVADFSSEMDNALRAFQQHLLKEINPDVTLMAASLSNTTTYRYIFYLERICPLLYDSGGMSDQRLEKILRFVRTFEKYEEFTAVQTFQNKIAGERHVFTISP